ncbi:MAG: hypothetical protein JNL05_09970 [Flavobacteriales bacterium]|nr:hypothetical protein [Flavobacteriales bacterium]
MRTAHLLVLALLPCALHATTWTVGAGQTHTLPSQVSTLVNDGDTVDILAGTYPGDVAAWAANDLLLRGVGGMAVLPANGNSWGGKAIWVIQGDRTRVEHIAFLDCSVPDQNGAGIRQEGSDLTVRHCLFQDNENGILGGEVHPSTIRIEHSTFDHNGYGDGYSHNLYIGRVDSLIFRYNYSHHAHVGHELKSRAWVNVIEYNRFSNEADGDASREIDLPDGGQAYLIGNVVQQGPQGQNSNLVGFAMESTVNPGPHALYAVNNTLVNEKTVGSFFQMPAAVYFKAYSNILAGGGSFMSAWPTTVDTLANIRSTSIAALDFANATTYDYHIGTASPADGTGVPAGLASNGYPLVAWDEYVHPAGRITRCQQALLDAGAFETCTTGEAEASSARATLYPVPAQDEVTVSGMDAGTALVELIDASGRIHLERTVVFAGPWRLDIGPYAAGPYLLRITGTQGTTCLRVIKE